MRQFRKAETSFLPLYLQNKESEDFLSVAFQLERKANATITSNVSEMRRIKNKLFVHIRVHFVAMLRVEITDRCKMDKFHDLFVFLIRSCVFVRADK